MSSDSSIEEVTSTLSLRCPLSYSKIEIPVKGANCTHTQCFDLKSFLMFSLQAQYWHCPVCSKRLAYKYIAIDTFFTEMLTNTKEDDTHVILNADGTYKAIDTDAIEHQKKKRKHNAPPSGSVQISLIDDDDDSSSSTAQIVTSITAGVNTHTTPHTSFPNMFSPPFFEAVTPPISMSSPYTSAGPNRSSGLVEIIDLIEE